MIRIGLHNNNTVVLQALLMVSGDLMTEVILLFFTQLPEKKYPVLTKRNFLHVIQKALVSFSFSFRELFTFISNDYYYYPG